MIEINLYIPERHIFPPEHLWSEILKGEDHFLNLGIKGRIKLKKWGRGYGLDSGSSGQTPMAGSCDSGLGSTKGEEFLYHKSNC
jgi:hypothetical protein